MKSLCFFVLLFSCSVSASQKLFVVGEAYDISGQQLLYKELHYYSDDGLDHRVVYQSSDNQVIAVKDIDYRLGFTTPTFSQQGTWINEYIHVSLTEGALLIKYTAPEKEIKKSMVQIKEPLVIDAGFDHFIRDNWQSLVTGERLTFYFAAPTRLSLVNLQVKNQPCSFSSKGDQCFQINSSSWFIRMLLDNIELGYDSKSKRLTRFKGLGNITDPSGETLRVDIRYRYQDLCTLDDCPAQTYSKL